MYGATPENLLNDILLRQLILGSILWKLEFVKKSANLQNTQFADIKNSSISFAVRKIP